jgi:hypothetical protein
MMIGGVSLSTAPTANAAPAPAGIGQASEAQGGIQLVGGYHGHHRGYRYHHRYYRYGYHYKPYYNYDWYPPYKGYCYDYPYHWWCKKYFHKGY